MPPRRKAANNVDIFIRGDEQEQHRIQLEHNLQHTDLSLHLSSPDVDDVEFPRHNSGPDQLNGFVSFDPPDHDHFDPDDHSQFNAWSYRTVDDDEGIDPYVGQTISTAAHHASALTLSAGLGRGGRRDMSMSGAEYDPERPLQNIMAGITSRISAFSMDDTKPKNPPSVDFDPLVVDDSAELELARGKRAPSGLRSPSSTSSSSRPATPLSPRPTLTDALSAVAFSPKRPRNDPAIKQATGPARNTRHVSRGKLSGHEENIPTSRTRSKAAPSYPAFPQQSLSYATIAEPEVNIQPPTSSEQPARSTKSGRVTIRESEMDAPRQRRPAENPAVPQNYKRRPSGKPAVEFAPQARAAHPRVSTLRTPYRDKLHLPDVTGLTSAIDSPARVALDYMTYDAQDDAEINARLTATLGIVQAKLTNLEAQNSISRRRVRELELELEECKHEVHRERHKVYDREQIISQQRADVKAQKQKLADTARLAGERASGAADQSRYKEVVEEQNALQSLVITLKGHLTRLTTELSDHHRLLEELRCLRDTDVRALKDKSRDVDNLRQEVERLGGEVEVLRGVVEEGLKQRREMRDASVEQMRMGDVEPDESFGAEQRRAVHEQSDQDSESEGESGAAPSPTPSPNRRANRTLRTDQATFGSPPVVDDESGPPFLDTVELERISEEVSERRIERSTSNSTISHRSQSPPSFRQASPAPPLVRSRSRQKQTIPTSRQAAVADKNEEAAPQIVNRGPSPANYRAAQTQTHIPVQEQRPASNRPRETPTTTAPQAKPVPRTSAKFQPCEPSEGTELPFPRIRGAYLERLFFSAPDHHAHTCTVCNLRQRKRAQNQWGMDTAEVDGRNLRERLYDAEVEEGKVRMRAQGKERAGEDERVPPQTVLARVLRELEDDFTHYREIYIELADQYKVIDPVTNVAKRNVLAEHLRDVIDILEQKGDQIASLYDLLTFNDKPAAESEAPHGSQKSRAPREAELAAAS